MRALRLTAHRLRGVDETSGDAPADAARAVGHMLAMQGQDLPGVLWAIGRRTPGATIDDVRAAFDRGLLVRTWPMRGTLHAITPADLRQILPLTSERVMRAGATRRAQLGIAEQDLDTARAAALRALDGVRGASRATLLAAFDDAGQPTTGQRGYHLLANVAIEGTIALGPFDGVEQLFVRLDHVAPMPAPVDDETALREVLRRYAQARGPVTLADAAWWTKLPTRPLRVALAELSGPEGPLVEVDVAGAQAWLDARLLDGSASRGPGVLLLPGFDELLLGYADRSATLAPERADRVTPGGNGVFRAMVVQRGRVVGVWSRTQRARGVQVDAELWVPATAALKHGVETEARRYAGFLGTPLDAVTVQG